MNTHKFIHILTICSILFLLTVSTAYSAISASHPRLMKPETITTLTTWSNSPAMWEPYKRFSSYANKPFTGNLNDAGILFAKALMWKMGKTDQDYLTSCLNNFDRIINGLTTVSRAGAHGQMVAMAYDLLYYELSPASQKNAVDQFMLWQNMTVAHGPVKSRYTLWNYAIARWAPAMMAAAAGANDPSNSTNTLSASYYKWKNEYYLPSLFFLNKALHGEMPEGNVYGTWFDARYFLLAADVVYNVESENTFSTNKWFSKRLTFEWQTFHTMPKLIDQYSGNIAYRNYHPWGHAVKGRAAIYQISRVNVLLLLSRLKNHPYSGQIYNSLYKNSDPEINKMGYDSTNYVVVYAFIYGAKDLESISTPESLQLWVTDKNEQYGPGKAFMRSGYSPDDISITYKAGDMFFRGHENLDDGSFQIFAKGEDLAIHSGAYGGSGELLQTREYWSSTVSTNNLIIYDPSESFYFVGKAKDNDGGHRTYTGSPQMYKWTGTEDSILNDWAGNSKCPGGAMNPAGANDHGSIIKAGNVKNKYSYIYSDITTAYNSDLYVEGRCVGNSAKVEKVTREIALVNSKYIIIFDKLKKKKATDFSAVVAEGEPYPNQDKWLLHAQNLFSVEGTETFPSNGEMLYTSPTGSFQTTVNNSILYGKVVYPDTNFQIRRFNGSKRYWNYQRNIPIAGNQGRWTNVEWGADRIEIEPLDTGLEHYYLVVLYPEYTTGNKLPPTIPINVVSGGMKGALIQDGSTNIAVLFGSTIPDSIVTGSVSYEILPTTSSVDHFLFDMQANAKYKNEVTVNTNGSQTITVTPDPAGNLTSSKEGALVFPVASSGVVDNVAPPTPKGFRIRRR